MACRERKRVVIQEVRHHSHAFQEPMFQTNTQRGSILCVKGLANWHYPNAFSNWQQFDNQVKKCCGCKYMNRYFTHAHTLIQVHFGALFFVTKPTINTTTLCCDFLHAESVRMIMPEIRIGNVHSQGKHFKCTFKKAFVHKKMLALKSQSFHPEKSSRTFPFPYHSL